MKPSFATGLFNLVKCIVCFIGDKGRFFFPISFHMFAARIKRINRHNKHYISVNVFSNTIFLDFVVLPLRQWIECRSNQWQKKINYCHDFCPPNYITNSEQWSFGSAITLSDSKWLNKKHMDAPKQMSQNLNRTR